MTGEAARFENPPDFCRDCGRPLISHASRETGRCGMCARRRRSVLRTNELADDWIAPEPWDGWGT